jgi:CBS domain containing-hemolysin-like protein
MAILITYVLIALGFSFLCSLLEATLLTVTPASIHAARSRGERWAVKMAALKDDVEAPLSAILTLNTVAHTMGAAGAGAQYARLYGNAAEGMFAGALTLAILIFTEIIPKTLGARYALFFARPTAWFLPILQKVLAPLVWFSRQITRLITFGKANPKPMHREELLAAAEIGELEGAIGAEEGAIVSNILRLGEMSVSDIMTPRTVIFTMPESSSIDDFVTEIADKPFSRIPVFAENQDDITGFVLRSDALLAAVKNRDAGDGVQTVGEMKIPIEVVPSTMAVDVLFQTFLKRGKQILMVANEFGMTVGLVTLEDVLETIVGVEIVDETDQVADMQKLARDLWKKRAGEKGIELSEGTD